MGEEGLAVAFVWGWVGRDVAWWMRALVVVLRREVWER